MILYSVIDAEFSLDCFLGRKKITYLNIKAFSSFVANKVNFFRVGFAYIHGITRSKQLRANNIFENCFNIPLIASVKSLPQSVVGNVVFFIGL